MTQMTQPTQVTSAAVRSPAAQQPQWPDPSRVRAVRRTLRALPAPVAPEGVDRLRERLAEVALGRALLLQGGDCAETFAGNTPAHIRANLRTLLHTATLLEVGSGLPVVPVGRMAGQYAKPRSSPTDAAGLPAYRGDIVNSTSPTAAARTPDPDRMLRARADAVATLDVMAAVAADADTELFASHEALLLDYEVPLVRQAVDGTRYGLSGHFLWIGERTRRLDGAHIELARGLANPVGVKVGPATTPAEVLGYADALDPHRTPGRLTLISRMGADRVAEALPPLVEAVAAAGHPVIWLCDPMHGNTRLSATGYKTRHLDTILAETRGFLDVHAALGSHAGGLHLEFTGDDVTECLGGSQGLRDEDLPARYSTACDPRLNARQSLDLASAVAQILLDGRRPAERREAASAG
ncbi:3-deoxy-7-phosphoheptulonate synthase [Actinacidiphila paucisporea]|uniref:Phospho-2-dehydro-3-deoxyheptonate aldolase n=1 Tax=Actinacidiphila paucisporea TaxID=310782 RepID=A0A1M7QF34_9ACTN|nr:3-deoxy-7-phosphoheptulonate synthase class II [Actinacidiphila paucisporea]SHN29444.1 3-deoxy-D-arabinoheptulosonate-7-phosphate synthase [Actinacidiphila paucisporea]